MSTFSIKRQIGGFASQSCSGRQRNVLKSWCTCRALVLIIKSIVSWSCLRRRRSCLTSLLPKICFRVKVLELNLLLAWEYCCLSSLPVVGDVSRERLHQWWRGMKCGCIRRLTLVSRYRVRSFDMIRIMVDQMNPWILVQSGFISSLDLPWSEWSRITDPNLDHPKGTHP